MSRRTHVLVHVAALLLAPAGAAVAQDRVLTPELILTIRQATDAQIAPDGSLVLVQVVRQRAAEEPVGGPIQELWVVPAAGGDPRRFTATDGDRAAQWSPDGRAVALLGRRPGSELTQVYLVPATGGEARAVTTAPNHVTAFRWSPDGGRIAYTVTDPRTQAEQEAARLGRDWTVADSGYQHVRLYAVEVATGRSHLVTRADLTVRDFDWSPDGQQLLIAAAPTPTVDDEFMRLSLRTVPASGGEPRLVVDTEGKLSHARWSPDGAWIAWLGATALNDPYAGSVFAVPSGGGAARNLTPGYDGTATWLGWLPGAPNTLAIVAIERQQTRGYTLSVADPARRPVAAGDLVLPAGMSFSRDGGHLAFPANTPAHPNEAFVLDRRATRAGPVRLTRLNPQLDGIRLGAQETVRWTSVDGLEIEGVLVKPVGYEPGRRYPVVLQPHGGPESADLNGWLGLYSRWAQVLAGRGFATFYPNYRGSIGRGPAFAMADHRDLMGREFDDMAAGLDHLVATGLADPERIGVGGGSYGGYTSAWAATYGSARFKAAVMWMGISNWYSMTGTSDIFFENSTVHWDAMMYDHFGLYWDRSPIAWIGRANTPTLIIHGAADPRVPIGQSREMYTALRWKGVPVTFVTYPREGHGVAERAHQLDFMRRVVGWFEKYLGR